MSFINLYMERLKNKKKWLKTSPEEEKFHKKLHKKPVNKERPMKA